MCGTAHSSCYLFYGFQPCYRDGVPGLHDGGGVGTAPSPCYLFYGFQPCYGDGVSSLHDGGRVGLLPLLVIYSMVFSHATGTVSLAYMMVGTAHSTCYLFYGFQPCYGDGVPGLHDGGCVRLLTLLVIYFMVFSHVTGTVSLAYMMVDVWDCSLY
jgi:hypothetical protein